MSTQVHAKGRVSMPTARMRLAALAAVGAALALPATAAAKDKTYAGETDGGGKIAFDVKVSKKGKVKKIMEARVLDLPTVCDVSGPVPSHLTFTNKVKVKSNGRFRLTYKQPVYGNVSKVRGRFNSVFVTGKLSVDYHFPAEDGYPEEDCATGKIDYAAVKGADDGTAAAAAARAR